MSQSEQSKHLAYATDMYFALLLTPLNCLLYALFLDTLSVPGANIALAFNALVNYQMSEGRFPSPDEAVLTSGLV